MKLKKIPLLLTGYILFSAIPVYANPLGLNQEDLAFCSEVRDERLQDVAREESTKKQATSGGVSITNLSGNGSHRYERTSSSDREHRMSEYYSKNCDKLLEAARQVNIAQINANKEEAIAQMKTQAQVELGKYSEDTRRILANIDLAGRRDDNRTERHNTLVNTSANLATAWLQSNVERKRIDAERKRIDAQVEMARLAADPNLALIKNWELETISCDNSTVSILIDNKTYCTKANNWLKAGVYKYIRAEDKLESMSQQSTSVSTNTNSNPQPIIQQVSQPSNSLNTNTNSNPQPTNESGL